MEKITSINAERIRWCCQQFGMDAAQLATDADIAVTSIESVLAGKGGLSFPQLQRLSKLFNRGVLFFLEPGPPNEAKLFTPQFRTLANQKPQITGRVRALIERAERQRDIFVSLRDELGEPLNGMALYPELPSNSPGEAGEDIRGWLNLSDRNTFESYRRAVEAKGVLVFRTNGYEGAWQIPKSDSVDGFCLFDEVCPIIVVRKHASEARQAFTLFHELGHLILHRRSFIDEADDLDQLTGDEREANDFAGRLLVPDRMLTPFGPQKPPAAVSDYESWLGPLRKGIGVSTEVILRRLMARGVVNQAQYNEYREWRRGQTFEASSGGSRAFRYREPVHVFGAPFARTVLEALAQNRITSVKASRYLDNLKLSDLRSLETYLAAV